MNGRLRSILVLVLTLPVVACSGAPAVAPTASSTPATPTASPVVFIAPDMIFTWNAVAQRTAITNAKQAQTQSLIYISFVQAAVYDAVVSIGGRYKPFVRAITASRGASIDAAVATAAHDVLTNYFAAQAADLDKDLATSLAGIPDGQAKTDGISVGKQAAAALVEKRRDDGLEADVKFVVPQAATGVWQPPAGQGPQTPWVAKLRPFTSERPDQFRPAPPPALTSTQFAKDFSEIRAMGGANSTQRGAEQTDVAKFWTTNAIVQYNAAFKAVALAHKLDVVDTARLYAMGTVLASDALIACFDAKYQYLFWRPQYAVPQGDSIGNSEIKGDATWAPLAATPNHPEYPAAHGCLTGAEAEILTTFLGSSQLDIDLTSTVAGLAQPTRHYRTADDLTREIADARVWAGLHYRTSVTVGVDLGKRVVQYGIHRYFASAS